MKTYIFILLAGFSLLLSSCQKDDATTGELMAKELQSVIAKNRVTRVIHFTVDQFKGLLPAFHDDAFLQEFTDHQLRHVALK